MRTTFASKGIDRAVDSSLGQTATVVVGGAVVVAGAVVADAGAVAAAAAAAAASR